MGSRFSLRSLWRSEARYASEKESVLGFVEFRLWRSPVPVRFDSHFLFARVWTWETDEESRSLPPTGSE
jgi:hypothetical protein